MLRIMLQNPDPRALWYRFRANASGTSAIEFAMLAPLFILLLLGMVAYGIYFGASHSVQQIAADAARTAIAGLNAAERKTLVTYFIDHDAAGYPFVDAHKLRVDAKDSTVDGSRSINWGRAWLAEASANSSEKAAQRRQQQHFFLQAGAAKLDRFHSTQLRR